MFHDILFIIDIFIQKQTIYIYIIGKFYEDVINYKIIKTEELDNNELKKSAKKRNVVKLGMIEGVTTGKNYFNVTAKNNNQIQSDERVLAHQGHYKK